MAEEEGSDLAYPVFDSDLGETATPNFDFRTFVAALGLAFQHKVATAGAGRRFSQPCHGDGVTKTERKWLRTE